MFENHAIDAATQLTLLTESSRLELELEPKQVDALLILAQRAERIGSALGLGKYRDLLDVVTTHIIDSLQFFRIFPDPEGRLVDVGSGAGFPGLVLAIANPQLDVVLVESRRRPVWFLRQMVVEFGLGNARVVRGRGEEVGRQEEYRGRFRFATARGVTRSRKTAKLLRPLLESGGHAVIYTGKTAMEREFPEGEPLAVEEYSTGVVWKGEEPGRRILLVLEAS